MRVQPTRVLQTQENWEEKGNEQTYVLTRYGVGSLLILDTRSHSTSREREAHPRLNCEGGLYSDMH
jgi:hypothetical protein